MFRAVSTDVSFPRQEEAVFEFWKRERIYERSLELRENGPPFIFFEGPPTANGMPHPGHCLPARSRIYSPAIDRCEVIVASGKPDGLRMDCPSR